MPAALAPAECRSALVGTRTDGTAQDALEIGQRIYQVTSSAIAVAGEEERIFAVSFLPVARGTADPDTNSTIVTGTMRQLR